MLVRKTVSVQLVHDGTNWLLFEVGYVKESDSDAGATCPGAVRPRRLITAEEIAANPILGIGAGSILNSVDDAKP